MAIEWFTASELAALALPEVPASESAMIRRAKRETWECRQRKGRGGGTEYHISSLPPEARQELARRHLEQAHPSPLEAVPDEQLKIAQNGLARLAETNGAARDRATSKLELLATFETWREITGLAVKPARTAFAKLWNEHQIPAPAALYSAVPQTSDSTLRRIQQQLGSEGAARLGGNQGKHRLGAGIIDSDPNLQQFILAMMKVHPDVSAAEIMRGLRARRDQFERLPAFRSLQRWLKDYNVEYAQFVEADADPNKFGNRRLTAFGNMSESLTRPNELWELDSTPGDLLLAGGVRHALIGAIDVYTRRFKLIVSRTSNSRAVAALTRRCLLDWGVPDRVKTDNGSDYISNHIVTVFKSLEVDHKLCNPGAGYEKPHIERVFKTFAHGIVHTLPGFIGHSVADRKKIEARDKFTNRLLTRDATIELPDLTPEALQEICDQWVEALYHHEPHGGLDGRTPFQVNAEAPGPVKRIEDERALDILLMPIASGNGLRRVTKKGIAVENTHFIAPELALHVGQTVRVFLDETDASAIYVQSEHGHFLCKAVAPERAGVSRAEIAIKARKLQQQEVSRYKAAAKKSAIAANVTDINREILEDRAREAGKLAYLPKQTETHTTPALEQARHAADAGKPPEAVPMTPDQAAQQLKIAREMAEDQKIVNLPETPKQRYVRALGVEQAIEAGRSVDASSLKWFTGYIQTSEFRAQKQVHEDFGAAYGINEGAN